MLGSKLFDIPSYIDIIKASLKFWHRLENLDQNSLLSDALECSKSLAPTSNSWFNTIQQYSNILGVSLNTVRYMKLTSFNTKLANILKDTVSICMNGIPQNSHLQLVNSIPTQELKAILVLRNT